MIASRLRLTTSSGSLHRGSRLFLATVVATALLAATALAQEKDGEIAFIGLHGGIFEVLKGFEDELNTRVDYLTYRDIENPDLDLSGYRVVYFQHLRREFRDRYFKLFSEAKKKNPDLIILSVSGLGLDLLPELKEKGIIGYDPKVREYYGGAGDSGTSPENLRRLLLYTLGTYLGRDVEILPPQEAVLRGLFHPDHEGFFETVDEFLAWAKKQGKDVDNLPRAVIAVHGLHLVFQQPKIVEALIRELEKRNILAVAMVDLRPPYEENAIAFKPDVIIHTCHSRERVPFRLKVDAPHLHSIFFRKQSISEWYDSIEGIDPGTVAFQVMSQEIIGAIEPQVGAGTLSGGGSGEVFEPITERIEHLVDRAESWIRLRHKPNKEKRVAIVYYNREMGKSELMRGTATGMFLNAPRSVVRLLKAMKEAGYTLDRVPRDEDELLEWLLKGGRQVGLWAPGELDRLVREGDPVLIPVETYTKWLEEKVPEVSRKVLIEKWGEPPGNILVWKDEKGEPYIVIPRVKLGNVILLPQPLRGEAHDINAVLHDRRVPPTHQYLATYFWLEQEFGADAVMHFGTHGTEFLLPGKEIGLSDKDWPDIIMGRMPNITPWIINNLGESLPVKRRAYAVLIDYIPPPLVNAGLSDALLNIHNDINKWETLEEGALRDKFRASITEQVKENKLDVDLHIDLSDGRILTEEEIQQVSAYLHKISNETTPTSLHVLGEPPREDQLIPYLVSCLRKKFLDNLAQVVPIPEEDAKFPGDREKYMRQKAEEAVRLVIRQGMSPEDAVRAIGGKVPASGLPEDVAEGFELAVSLNEAFKKTTNEIDNILRALDGRFIEPGPANEPSRNPSSVPSGRNMYTLNPEEIPSQPSWELGKQLVDQLLERQLEEKGRYPERVGFSLSSFATFADYGVMEAQILYLMGVEPVWDARNLVRDVRLIPIEELGRPRIDVFIALGSYYRDNLPSRMRIIDKAIRLVASTREKGNAIYENTERVKATLIAKGIPEEKARELAFGRMFGYPRGQYGSARYYYLVERSGEWDTREDLMKIYLDQSRNVYTGDLWGEPAEETYNEMIQGTEVVVRSWSRSMTSPLANKYMWYRGGSLALAVKYLTGKEPEFYISDVRDPDRAGMVTAEDALRQEYRVRLFNRKWIEGMMKEGYAGADQISVMVKNTMGWKIMRENSVQDDIWEEIVAIYVRDKLNLAIREWFESENPYAFQELTEILLESARKGYWNADAETLQEIAQAYAESVVRHGENGGLLGGGNTKLERFIEEQLQAPGTREATALLAKYRQKVSESQTVRAGAPSPTAQRPETVTGQEMKKVESESTPEERPIPWAALGLILVVLVLIGAGYRWRRFPRSRSGSSPDNDPKRRP